jgi:hypothetical protein
MVEREAQGLAGDRAERASLRLAATLWTSPRPMLVTYHEGEPLTLSQWRPPMMAMILYAGQP